ncbi:MAG: glycoside hydrolase family protein [Armatimonadia bacterium]
MQGLNIDLLFDRLRIDEGLVLKVYKCPAGKRTIGYGHNIEAKGLPDYIEHHLASHGSITREMAEYLLDQDLSEAIRQAQKSITPAAWEKLTPDQRGALVLMAYQMGGPGLRKFKMMIASIELHDIPGAVKCGADSDWYRNHTARAERTLRMMEG